VVERLVETKARVSNRALRPGVPTVLVGAGLAAWIVLLLTMRGMDGGPGTDLGTIGWFLGIWVTMTAAMMLPSATPMVLVYSKVAVGSSRRPGASIATFVAGYLAAWTAFGLVAYGLFRLVRSLDPSFLAWDRAGPIVAGTAIVVAGAYQLTPLKRVCLRHCRTPFHWVLHRWRDGPLGPARMGLEHGAYCVGCCWALMLVLFAVGVMSLAWMAVVAGLIFAEKVLPLGERLSAAFAVALLVLGVWVAVAPESVPFLTQPGMPMS
jgi:predicted metal-binding membrane protein